MAWFLEKLIQENKSSQWFVGNTMSIADLAIWRLIGWIISGKLDHVPTTIIESFPSLSSHYSSVDAVPKVREWMSLKYDN